MVSIHLLPAFAGRAASVTGEVGGSMSVRAGAQTTLTAALEQATSKRGFMFITLDDLLLPDISPSLS